MTEKNVKKLAILYFLTLINKNNSIIMLSPDLFVISHVIISQMDSVL